MKNKCDVLIIGSGIGGMVCGCYLARRGLDVLIVEQCPVPGGYCVSFRRKGIKFDSGIHYLGSMRRGALKGILEELDVDLEVAQYDVSDKISFPDFQVELNTDVRKTIVELQRKIPADKKNIRDFFNFLAQESLLSIFSGVKKKTLDDVLDGFFTDRRTKSVFRVLIGNKGISADIAAAFPALMFLREYLTDGGYYPAGGMGELPGLLLERFQQLGGKAIFSRRVTRMEMSAPLKKVFLDNGDSICAKAVVSNADATETFTELLNVKCRETGAVSRLRQTPSLFLVYLALRRQPASPAFTGANIWHFDDYDVNKIYSQMRGRTYMRNIKCILCTFPSAHDIKWTDKAIQTATLYMHTPYHPEQFWEAKRTKITEMLINYADNLIPGLRERIIFKFDATPHTFLRYTSNKEGAFIGTLTTREQTKINFLPQKTSIPGLYLVGQWCSLGSVGQGGVTNVALSGKKGALSVLQYLGVQ